MPKAATVWPGSTVWETTAYPKVAISITENTTAPTASAASKSSIASTMPRIAIPM